MSVLKTSIHRGRSREAQIRSCKTCTVWACPRTAQCCINPAGLRLIAGLKKNCLPKAGPFGVAAAGPNCLQTASTPGPARNGLPAGKSARAIRLKVEDKEVRFVDLVQGEQSENLCKSVGDFVIRRADGYPAYQLAVVVDDAFQSIDRVVRGADLLSSTARQIWLQQCLSLPTPEYAHVPLVTDRQGRKLSKQFRSDPVRDLPANQALKLALEFLGQTTSDSGNTRLILEAAVANWRLARVPADAAMLPTIPGSD